MPFNLRITPNHLPACDSPYIAQSGKSDVVSYERFIDIMSRGKTALSKGEIRNAMELFKVELQKQLEDGKTVKTLVGTYYLCASGRLNSLDEAFQPKDKATGHKIRLHHRPDKNFEQSILPNLKIVRDEEPDRGAPKVKSVQVAGEDQAAGIHPGSMVQVRGLRLRFDPKDPKQGVFFADASGAEQRSTFYPANQPGSILASVPAGLAAGTYTLIVRAAVNGKDVRSSSLEGLAIASA